jgi:O-antigen/teichoic acid export membrane protein
MKFFLNVFTFLNEKITKGHSRSVKAKKNIIASFLIRSLSISISIVLVPLTINFVNPSRYGIWLTLSSIVAWFSFFDIGLTQGLRNKFVEAKENGDNDLAQTYVSTTYAILAIVFFIVWAIFLIVNHFLNWSHILNVSESFKTDISTVAIIVFTYFCLQFVLRVITTILTADQYPAKASLIDLLGQALSLVVVVVLVKVTEGSLVKLGIALCASPLLILVAANIFLFKTSYKNYKPAFNKINFSYAKGLLNLGIIFFIIQVAGVVQYESANIIIARNFGTSEVTSYNIVYRYFGILTMVFTIFLTPFWSSSTEAYLKNDIDWIRNGIKKYNKLNIVLIVLGILMLFFADKVYLLWLGKAKVHIDFLLSLWGFIFFNVSMFGGKYVMFLNGISALRIQFWASVISPFIYILISMILINYYHMGVYSLFIASVIANFNGYLLAPLQYHQIINNKRKGIWIK